MKNTNVPGVQPGAHQKSRKKLIVGAIIGSLLVVGIALGATTNFMGKFTTITPGSNTAPSTGESSSTSDLSTNEKNTESTTKTNEDTSEKTSPTTSEGT